MREHLPMIDAEQRRGDSADLQRSLTQMARCLNELTQQLEAVTRGDAPAEVFEETRPLIKALTAQINGEGADADARPRRTEEPLADEESDHAGQDFERRLRAQTEEPCANTADLKRAMHWEIAAAQSDWQARLDSDLATATNVWSERIKSSIENSSQRAAELVMQSSQQTARQLEQSIGARIAAMSKSFVDASGETEIRIAAVRDSLDNELKRAHEILAQVSSAATAVDGQAAKLAAITEIAQQELSRRGATTLEWHSQELVRCATQSIAEWNERLQAALEGAGQRIVGRLGVEFEQQLNSRLDLTRGILDRLESEGRTAENLLRTHQGRMEKFSEQAVEIVIKRLEKAGADWESRIGEARRAATAKWVPEINSESAAAANTFHESKPPQDQPGDVKARAENIGTTALAKERRGIRRIKISRPLLTRPEDPAHKETVETTRNASRCGVYFTTATKHYYVGMRLRVTPGYTPNDPCNVASFGEILRIDPLENGSWGVAVRLRLR